MRMVRHILYGLRVATCLAALAFAATGHTATVAAQYTLDGAFPFDTIVEIRAETLSWPRATIQRFGLWLSYYVGGTLVCPEYDFLEGFVSLDDSVTGTSYLFSQGVHTEPLVQGSSCCEEDILRGYDCSSEYEECHPREFTYSAPLANNDTLYMWVDSIWSEPRVHYYTHTVQRTFWLRFDTLKTTARALLQAPQRLVNPLASLPRGAQRTWDLRGRLTLLARTGSGVYVHEHIGGGPLLTVRAWHCSNEGEETR